MAKKKILEIQNVKLFTPISFSSQLSIAASGTVPTTAWKNAELIPYIYIQPPEDGIYDYDFVAEPPEGIAANVITPIQASSLLENMPNGFRGVRIHSSTNVKVALFDSSSGGRTICIRGVLTDEGVECQTLRTATGELYTLVGNLKGFQVGYEVLVAGTTVDVSFCQQGITVVVSWIGKSASKNVPVGV